MGSRELKPFGQAYSDINDSNKKEPRDLCNFNNVNTSFTNVPSNGLSSPPRKTTFFKFCWWNGGGKIKCRLKTNPELRNFLNSKPDLFAYGESETPSPLGLSVNGYACYVHKSKLTVIDNYRRGLAIFYLKKYQFLLTKVYSSKTYDLFGCAQISLMNLYFAVFFRFFLYFASLRVFFHILSFFAYF